MSPILILGIGNILMCDDGVGVRALEALRQVPLPDTVELLDGGTFGADLLDEIANRRKVIVLDAMATGAAPGSVLRLAGDELWQEQESLSLHEFGLVETLKMARQLGCAPAEVVVFGVQPQEIALNLTLSTAVAAAIPRLLEQVLAELAAGDTN